MHRNLNLDEKIIVRIDIQQPVVAIDTDGHYICHFSISGLSTPVSSFGMGVDSVQAIYIALQLIGNTLYTCSEFLSGRLTWDDAAKIGDLGFPVAS